MTGDRKSQKGRSEQRRGLRRDLHVMIELLATHLCIPDRRRAQSFAGLLLTTIEGAYVRGRAERSTQAFDEAASLLGEMADTLARP